MRLESVFRMLLDGIPLLLIAAVLILSVFAVGYLLIYRVILKGTKRLKFSKVLWILLLVSYLGVLCMVTVFRPGEGWHMGRIYPLFYSYKSAWRSFNAMEWRNLILNIAMFVPFGFLLPMSFEFFQKFWKTYLAGFLVTFGIESAQLIFKMGVVECDDIFNNFLGVMIGYGFYAIVCLIVNLIKKRRHSIGKTLAFQIPFAATILMFTVIFAAYHGKELGNLNLYSIEPVTAFEIISNKEYSANTQKAMVYKADILDKNRADQMAEEFFSGSSSCIDETRTDYYDETAVYYTTDSRDIWINYIGPTYDYTDFNVGFGNEKVAVEENAADGEIIDVLRQYGIFVPKETEFSTNGDGIYYITVDHSLENGQLYDGVIRCTYYKNGVMGNINNSLIVAKPYKEFELISEQEAFEKICNGEIKILISDEENVSVVVRDVSLSYELDTKGYYQPVYVFLATAGNWELGIEVPAVKQ